MRHKTAPHTHFPASRGVIQTDVYDQTFVSRARNLGPTMPAGMRFASTFEEGLHEPFYATTGEIETGTVRGLSRRSYLHFTLGAPLE